MQVTYLIKTVEMDAFILIMILPALFSTAASLSVQTETKILIEITKQVLN
jgi:hypothetical protein